MNVSYLVFAPDALPMIWPCSCLSCVPFYFLLLFIRPTAVDLKTQITVRVGYNCFSSIYTKNLIKFLYT